MVKIMVKIIYPDFFKLSKDTWIFEHDCEEIEIRSILHKIIQTQEGSNLKKILEDKSGDFLLVLWENNIYNIDQRIKTRCENDVVELTLIPMFEGGINVD